MKQSGFTLVEMIVVVAIIGLLSTLIVLQFSDTNSSFALDNGEGIVRSDIRRVLTLATSGATCCTDSATPEGYGIVFEPSLTSYTMYAEGDGDQIYSTSGADEIIQNVDLEDDELINNVVTQTCSPADTPGGPCDLFIEVPAGTIYTNGERTSDLSVTLQQTDTGDTVEITLDLDSAQMN
jgi:prepilin-type N-terminal cleavage/methylation domain-containing protein